MFSRELSVRNNPFPDMVIFLTAPFELVNKLRTERIDNDGIANDIYEKKYVIQDGYCNGVYSLIFWM